jgi:hypothetical protein
MKANFKYCLYFLIILGGSSFSNMTPSEEVVQLGGHWSGYLTQELDGLAKKYYFKMEIKQEKNTARGFTTITMINDSQIFGKMSFTGDVRYKTLKFKEDKIIRQNIYQYAYWCIKSATLVYRIEQNTQILEGHWEGCGTSSEQDLIHVERVIM